MRFAKPIFDELKLRYEPRPESVHDCDWLHVHGVEDVATSAARLAEALVLANRLVASRADIAALPVDPDSRGKNLLARFGYKTSLCPHGVARGARDLTYFLQDQWGRPTLSFEGSRGAAATAARQDTDPALGSLPTPSAPGAAAPAPGAASVAPGADSGARDAAAPTTVDRTVTRLSGLIGIVAFLRIDGLPGQGHVDLWDRQKPLGRAYHACERVLFWKLD